MNPAYQAAETVVKYFMHVSSVKINSEAAKFGWHFEFNEELATVNAYGLLKWEIEKGLSEIIFNRGMELIMVCPTLVYGSGIMANLHP